MKLLVVDDESDIQLLFQQKFRKEIKSGKIEINYARNGVTALELLETFTNREECLILTDLNMPQMNGIELLKEIKKRYPGLKVMIITAYGDEYSTNMAKNLGADDYFTKPLQFDLLREKLNYRRAI
jgi:CheY-like chemotaxis protein